MQKILFGRKEDRTYRKADEERNQEQRDHFHWTIYCNLKWNAFPSDHCWRTDGVDELSLIGSVMFESIAAGFGTASVGVQLGADTLTPLALDMAVWTMILGSIGWIIFATISASRMDKVQHKISGGDPAKLMAISSAAIIGAFSSMSSSHLIKLNKNSVACVLGAVFMAILLTISEKKNIKWLKEWNLTISILAAMIITAVI